MKIRELYDNPWDLPGIPIFIGGDGAVLEAMSVSEIISALNAIKKDRICTRPEKKLLEALIGQYMIREKKMEGREKSPKPN